MTTAERLATFTRRGLLAEKYAKLLEDFAKHGESCAQATSAALTSAEVARDVNEKRKALGKILADARKLLCIK
jgi:hypothetical protein